MVTAHPIHELIHEHHYILKVVHSLSLFDTALERNESVDTELLRRAVDFMREFADRCHHAKEEKILFPAMTRKGVPETGCPLEGLLREHAQGRELVTALARANAAQAAGEAGAADALRAAIAGIQQLYPNHIWKEDQMVFPMAEKLFDPAETSRLATDFAAAERAIGAEHERHAAFADELLERLQAALAR
jgi:hemerythrin-like domain-containing protein